MLSLQLFACDCPSAYFFAQVTYREHGHVPELSFTIQELCGMVLPQTGTVFAIMHLFSSGPVHSVSCVPCT